MGRLSEHDHGVVSAAVAGAENATSGEILPVIAETSDGYSDIMLVWAAVAAFTAMSVIVVFPEFYMGLWDRLFGGGWESEWTIPEFASFVILAGLLKFAGTWALLLIPRLRFWLIPSPVKAQRVRQAAVRHFKVGAERRTHGRTGVLLYLSMREHRAEIVADATIAEKVPAEVWGAAMADMLGEIRQGRVAEGLAAGVRDVGVVLAEHFPRGDEDVNELPDRLIEL